MTEGPAQEAAAQSREFETASGATAFLAPQAVCALTSPRETTRGDEGQAEKAFRAVPRQGEDDETMKYNYAQIPGNPGTAYLYPGDVARAEAAFTASWEADPDQPLIRRALDGKTLTREARALSEGENLERAGP